MRMATHETKTIEVYADRFWNETGINVQPGDRYQFEAAGQWKDWFFSANADGYTNWYMRLFDRKKRSLPHKWFALIGTLDKTSFFLIGRQRIIAFEQGGVLSLFANDHPRFYGNNSGHVRLTITKLT